MNEKRALSEKEADVLELLRIRRRLLSRVSPQNEVRLNEAYGEQSKSDLSNLQRLLSELPVSMR